jgi:hypothetical protein
MKPSPGVMSIIIMGLMVQVAQAGPGSSYQTIDDFDSGAQEESALQSGSQRDYKTGSMLGGSRHVVHKVSSIGPLNLGRKGVYMIDKGHLIVEDGVSMASRLEISYGIDETDNVTPLNLDLSPVLTTGQFTLHFYTLDMLNQVDAIIQVATRS